MHENPEVVKPEYRLRLSQETKDKKTLKKYARLLTAVRQRYDKLLRYPVYFQYFYPTDGGITQIEALEHHVHAYLEDMDALRDKLKIYYNCLEKDLLREASNKKEVKIFFKVLEEKIYEVFKNATKIRVPHHHKGMSFTDNEILDHRTASLMLDGHTNSGLLLSPEGIIHFEKMKSESLFAAKNKWIQIANNNNDQMIGFISELFNKTDYLVYQFLKINRVQSSIREELTSTTP